MTLIITVLIGLAAGGLSGLLGIGGGAIVVPALVLGLGITQHLAQGVSLAVIIPTSIAGLFNFHRKGLIIYRMAAWLAVGSIAGMLISAYYVHFIPSFILKKYFGIFLALVGVRMLIDQKANHCPEMEDNNGKE